jgi:hypothetical protein
MLIVRMLYYHVVQTGSRRSSDDTSSNSGRSSRIISVKSVIATAFIVVTVRYLSLTASQPLRRVSVSIAHPASLAVCCLRAFRNVLGLNRSLRLRARANRVCCDDAAAHLFGLYSYQRSQTVCETAVSN